MKFRVHGTPKGQPRARAFVRRGKKGFRASVYDPGTADEWKAAVRNAALDAIGCEGDSPDKPWFAGEPIYMSVVYIFPRPKSHFRTGKHAGKLKPNAPHWHTSKPDRNNVEKAFEDALGNWPDKRADRPVFWDDDCKVVAGESIKRYANLGEGPGAIVEITPAYG